MGFSQNVGHLYSIQFQNLNSNTTVCDKEAEMLYTAQSMVKLTARDTLSFPYYLGMNSPGLEQGLLVVLLLLLGALLLTEDAPLLSDTVLPVRHQMRHQSYCNLCRAARLR